MAQHYLGVRVNGALSRFSQPLDDASFESLTAGGLPAGWVAWHIDDSESLDNSAKVKGIAELPVLVVVRGRLASLEVPKRGPIESAYPLANCREWFALASTEPTPA